MKLKVIKVPNFIHKDDFDEFIFHDVEILFDPEVNVISPETFNQEVDEFFLSDEVIKKLSHDSAIRFYNERIKEVLMQSKPLSNMEVKGIKDFLGVNGSGLGELIGLDKSSISRALSGKQPIIKDKAMLLMERLKEEIDGPGYNKILLRNLSPMSLTNTFNELGTDVLEIAEYFVRKFFELESSITQLKLQKLIYYAQGIGFGRYEVKLFNDSIFAWKHGPVVKSVYDKYKEFGKLPLGPSQDLSLENIENNEKVLNILEETIALYGIYDAWVLRTKTHNESPWLETDRDGIITDEKMISCFRKLLV